MKTIHISREAVVIVSDEDFDFLSSFNWSLNPQGTMYAVRTGRKNTGEPRTVAMPREIMKAPTGCAEECFQPWETEGGKHVTL